MKNFIETPVYSVLCRIFDLVLLNLLYLLCCIPIFTIGAATAALYTSLFALIRDDAHILTAYFRSFFKIFKISTLSWLFWLVAMAIICADFGIIALYWTIPGKFVLLGLLTLGFFLLLATGSYVFPLLGTTAFRKPPVSAAFILSIRHLPRTILICLINLLPVGLLLFWTYGFLLLTCFFLLIGFSLNSYIVCLLLRKTGIPPLPEPPSP